MSKPSKTKSAHGRRAAKTSSHESAPGSDFGGDIISGAAGDVLHGGYDQLVEGTRALAARSSPEIGGLGEAAEQREEAEHDADADAKAFQRELQRASAKGQGQPDPAAIKELADKEAAAKKSAGDAEFASGRLSSDQSALDAVKAKIRELDEERGDYSTLDLGKWALTGTQNSTESEAQYRLLDQLLKQVAQDKEKKFTAAGAAEVAKENLNDSREALLSKYQSAEPGTGSNLTLPQVADALGKANEANKKLLETLKSFEATADALKTYSTAIKQKLDDITRTLETNTRAIQELKSSRQCGMPIPNP